MDANEIWAAALDELELQMTRETFGAWLRPVRAIGIEGDVLQLAVASEMARDWLENRLRGTIERTLQGINGRAYEVAFVVEAPGPALSPTPARAPKPPEPPPFVAPDFDTHTAGWFPTSAYENRFWAPLLGRVAWRVWQIVREADTRRKKTEWTPPRRWSAPALATLVPCGKQAVVGVVRRVEEGTARATRGEDGAWRLRQPGALERLVGEGIGQVRRRGEKRHTTYVVQVRVKLPLLRPEQVARLMERLQMDHDRWLQENGIDPTAWFG